MSIVEGRYVHVAHVIPADLDLPHGEGFVKVFACNDCGQAIVEGRGPKKNGVIRYPEYYRRRHDQHHARLERT